MNNSHENDIEHYMSIYIQKNSFGCSFYEVHSSIIHMIPDIDIDCNNDTLLSLILEISPKQFITTRQVFEKLKQILQTDENEYVLSEEGFFFVTNTDISYDLSLRKIHQISLPNTKNLNEEEKSIYIRSLIPIHSYNMIKSFGGLLVFLEKQRVGIELEGTHSNIHILDFQLYTLKSYLYIDNITLKALNIFNKVSHPSGFKQGLKSDVKEGPSIFNLLNYCHSNNSCKLLSSWLRRPLVNESEINNRLNMVEFFRHSSNTETVSLIQHKLKYISNIKFILYRMKQCSTFPNDWLKLYQSLLNMIGIYEIINQINIELEIVNKVKTKFSSELYNIISWMQKIIEFDDLSKQNRFVVKEGIDADLDEKKRKYVYLPELLTNLAKEELELLDTEIDICGIIYLPQLGYILTIPVTENESIKEKFKNLEFLFSMNDASYFKNDTTRKLDKTFGDILYEIKDHETTIMYQLQESILPHTHVLLEYIDVMSELDCILSLSMISRQTNWNRPIFTSKASIEIINGRHPLQELYSNPFIANSTVSNDAKGRITLITGSNGSGKSVYLKQIGILVILAQIGCFVPADKFVLSPKESILSRLKSIETSMSGYSTFMVDLNQISLCCRKSSKNSLILCDEFAKGVEKNAGLSIVCAFVKYYLNKQNECPHIFIATHFHAIINILNEYTHIQYKMFKIIEDQNSNVVYLYKLIDGITNTSHAIQVAKNAGIPEKILNRSKQIGKIILNGEKLSPADFIKENSKKFKKVEVISKIMELNINKENYFEEVYKCLE